VLNRAPNPLISFLHTKITHIIYVVDENRTYDQVLGDLSVGNGNPAFTTFTRPVTPNLHALAELFVDLDNYYSVGESSGVGWNWSLEAADTDSVEKSQAVLYGNADYFGLTYDYQGTNRNVNLGMPQTSGSPNQFDVRETGLLDPTGSSSILPGTQDIAARENAGDLDPGAVGGYIWDEALRRGLTVRDYGMHIDLDYYGLSNPLEIPISRTPYASNIPQAPPTKVELFPNTDVYYRAFDQQVPDTYRYEEWDREFNNYVANGDLPNLEVITLPHDHFGDFGTAIEGLDTPTLQMADNDWAFGQLVQAVSNSPYWGSTLIVHIEDDSQSGIDHVDAHRAIGFLIGPYVRHSAVVSQLYNTDTILRTIEDILGMNHLTINDANAPTMAAAFQTTPDMTPYTAIIPGVLCEPPVAPDLVPACSDPSVKRTKAVRDLHDGAWWARMTQGMNFRVPDANNDMRFNHILWLGLRGTPYPDSRNGVDYSNNRAALLAKWSSQTAGL
ncbi:MAG TPA: alkaline phosphatase family protein, partial [Candidatus Eremiobacteraceae bacterium]|nr:alkaline phosphatase family protein [Candidatus Eremiobacteraceae bacterium]